MSAYKELDDAIVEHIRNLPGRHPIYSSRLSEMAAMELDVNESSERVWRLIDRRLQAMKKQGRISFTRPPGKWEIA